MTNVSNSQALFFVVFFFFGFFPLVSLLDARQEASESADTAALRPASRCLCVNLDLAQG